MKDFFSHDITKNFEKSIKYTSETNWNSTKSNDGNYERNNLVMKLNTFYKNTKQRKLILRKKLDKKVLMI